MLRLYSSAPGDGEEYWERRRLRASGSGKIKFLKPTYPVRKAVHDNPNTMKIEFIITDFHGSLIA